MRDLVYVRTRVSAADVTADALRTEAFDTRRYVRSALIYVRSVRSNVRSRTFRIRYGLRELRLFTSAASAVFSIDSFIREKNIKKSTYAAHASLLQCRSHIYLYVGNTADAADAADVTHCVNSHKLELLGTLKGVVMTHISYIRNRVVTRTVDGYWMTVTGVCVDPNTGAECEVEWVIEAPRQNPRKLYRILRSQCRSLGIEYVEDAEVLGARCPGARC